MKTKELIDQLLTADPTGEAEVLVGSETDIQWIERQVWYYDGYPVLLDWDEKINDIKGMNVLYEPETGLRHKVVIHEYDIDTAILDNPDVKITIDKRISKNTRDRYNKRFEAKRKRVKKIIQELEDAKKVNKEINEITD